MKKLIILFILFGLTLTANAYSFPEWLYGLYQQDVGQQEVEEPMFGAAPIFRSYQVGVSPTNGYVLQTNGATSTWAATTTLGIGSDGYSAFAWTPKTTYGALANATGTPIWLEDALYASSTAFFDGLLTATTLAFPNDTVEEADVLFSTACAAGNHYYLSGTGLACEADDDTTYTAGDNLTLNGTDFDLDANLLSLNSITSVYATSTYASTTAISGTIAEFTSFVGALTGTASGNLTTSDLSPYSLHAFASSTYALQSSASAYSLHAFASSTYALQSSASAYSLHAFASTTYGLKVGSSDILTVGALNAGSITSGFTSIDVGAGTIDTTGAVSFGFASTTALSATNINFSGTLAGAGGRFISTYTHPTFTYASTTAMTGTTTIRLGFAGEAETWDSVRCESDGTLNTRFGDGTNYTTMFSASSTVGVITFVTSNVFTAGERREVQFGTPVTATWISCTVTKHY